MQDYETSMRMEVEQPTDNGEKEVILNDSPSDSNNKSNDEKDDSNDKSKKNENEESKDNDNGESPSSSTDSDDDDSDDSDKDFTPTKDPELILIKATALKEEGNNFFKEKDYEKASRSYRRGTNALKPLNKRNMGDEQVKALLISLQTNLSMMCFKLNNHKQSLQVATNALKIDGKNVKALYRRAAAHRKLGNLEEARDDLREALKHDSNNNAIKKELVAVKKELEVTLKAQKKGLQKAFGQGGSFLYNDKEEEKRRKVEEKRLQKKQEEEAIKKRKVEWEDECVKRMAKGEPALSFEEWEKERKAEEEAALKKKKEEEKRRKEERKKARAAAKREESDSDDDELTEKELAQFRGYKKTADGKVTSYFTREQSQKEKSLIGDIAPKRLEPTTATNNSNNPQSITPSSSGEAGGKGNPSAWNQAGTWEEKDTTDWCRSRLESRLKETKAESGSVAARVTKVDNMTGDASVAIVSGKKRYIFDFHCKLDFEIIDPDDDEVLASGALQLPDICSTHHEELEVTFNGWKKSPGSDRKQNVFDCQHALSSEVRESVKLWVTDFNGMY